MNKLYDLRFYYNRFNCFPDDTNRSKKIQLQDYLSEHSDKFTYIDYLNTSRYKIMIGLRDDSSFWNISNSDENYNISNTELMNNVKNFINSLSNISIDLKQWTIDIDETDESDDEPSPVISSSPTSSSPSPVISPVPNDLVIINSGECRANGYSNYDLSANKLLSFDEFRKITLNIAISQLNKDNDKDETMLLLEKEKRKTLINEINTYINVPEISDLVNIDDLSTMSIERLEYCRDKCSEICEQFKVLDLFKNGGDLIGCGCKTFFPRGIPLGKDRYIKFDGLGDTLKKQLLDKRTISGLTTTRLLKKWNLRVSDEVYNIILVIGKGLQSISIVNESEPKTINKIIYKKKYANREII